MRTMFVVALSLWALARQTNAITTVHFRIGRANDASAKFQRTRSPSR